MNNKNIKNDSNNKNKIKKPIIFIGLFILLCIICISILFIISKNRNNSNNEYNYNYGENYSKSDLPDLSQINPDNNPILYDFVNGSIGYKIDLDSNGCYFNDLGNFYAILENLDDKVMYISDYSYGEQIERPIIGSNPSKCKLDNSEVDNIKDFTSNVSTSRIFNEEFKGKQYTLVLISKYNVGNDNDEFNACDTVGKWCGIELMSYIPIEYKGDSQSVSEDYKSPMYKTVIDNGYGYPTDWINKGQYLDIMLNAGYDMTNEFWSRWNIDQIKTYKRKNDNGVEEELKVKVDQVYRFNLTIGGSPCYLNEEQLNDYLKLEGWI